MNLKGVWRQVKDFSGHINEIGDDDDLGNIIMIWGLVDITSHSKKFSFGTGDVNYVIDSLGDGVIMGVYMRYRYSNVILDASIYDYNGSIKGKLDALMTMLSSWWVQALLFFCLLCKLNTKQSEKLSIILWLGESLEWRGVKEEKIPLNLLFISTKWLLMRRY